MGHDGKFDTNIYAPGSVDATPSLTRITPAPASQMVYGVVLTNGVLAAAIESHDGTQYYAPLEECDPAIFEYPHADVCFNVDLTQFEGSTYAAKRYYAYNVKLIIV